MLQKVDRSSENANGQASLEISSSHLETVPSRSSSPSRAIHLSSLHSLVQYEPRERSVTAMRLLPSVLKHRLAVLIGVIGGSGLYHLDNLTFM